MTAKTITDKSIIMCIDDDYDDCILLKSSLEDAGSKATLICATDGEEAMKYLNSTPVSSLPSLIVLDMNMLRWDGQRTLSYLKSQPRLAQIQVVVLSTSEDRKEKETCAQLGAVSYFNKPFHYDGYKSIVANLNNYVNVI